MRRDVRMIRLPLHSIFSAGSQAPRFFCRGMWPALVLALMAWSVQAQQLSLLDAARDAINNKQYVVAEQLCRKALAQGPPSVKVLTTLGLSLHMQGRSADAAYYYSTALNRGYVPETY